MNILKNNEYDVILLKRIMTKNGENMAKKNTNTFLNKILEAKENFKWQENDSENDEAIRTALIMIGGIRNDK